MTDKNDTASNENANSKALTQSPSSESDSSTPESAIKQDTPLSNTSSSNVSTSTDSATKNSPLASVALLFGAAALGLSGWQFYQQTVNQESELIASTENKVVLLEQSFERLNRNVEVNSNAVRRLDTIETDVNAVNGALDKANLKSEQAFVDLSMKINKLSNADKNDWLLAEAEYLIRLANQRLLLEKDTKSSISLLNSADVVLANLEDPLMFETRKAIAQDIQALKSVSNFDLEGRYLQLSALYDQVPTLPQREPSKDWKAQQVANASQPENTDTTSLKYLLSEAWAGLKSLVVINYNQKPIEALLPATEYQTLVTGLQLQLEVAQVALMKREPAIFSDALSRIAKAVNQHFDPSSQATIGFMTTLTSLQQVNPNPDVPMPRASLQAMKTLMQDWKNTESNNKNEVAPVTIATDTKEDSTVETKEPSL